MKNKIPKGGLGITVKVRVAASDGRRFKEGETFLEKACRGYLTLLLHPTIQDTLALLGKKE